ncbi:MAG: HU family DNA-binding protein [Thermoanaerobaculia bacterium]|nr:HU family DNA-binding protein [Thermoanaerobaculia bacterium]
MAGKADIVNHIADCIEGISKKDAAAALDCMVEAISTQLARGERVSIPGFGSFIVGDRAARMGRNPKTGEAIKIKASKSVRFKAGKDLKDRLN